MRNEPQLNKLKSINVGEGDFRVEARHLETLDGVRDQILSIATVRGGIKGL